MKSQRRRLVPVVVVVTVCAASVGYGLWSPNGNPVCTVAGDQKFPEVVSDGAGGMFIAWHDGRNGDDDIYAQHIDADGDTLWAAGGAAVCTASADQQYPRLVRDGGDGVIITWIDNRGGEWDLYAQRLDAAGLPLWASGGVVVTAAPSWQSDPRPVSDGRGGVIIAWTDNRTYDPDDRDIYAQRVDSSGVVQWTTDGVPVCTPWNWMQQPKTAPDGTGGAFIAWMDIRTGSKWRVYAQWVDASGTPRWTTDGIVISATSGDEIEPDIAANAPGEAIITWYSLNGTSGVYAQRVDTTGVVKWVANGVPICSASGDQRYPRLDADGAGGAIISWRDPRNGNEDIYAQRIDSTGTVGWTANGVAVCTAAGNQERPQVASDAAGGAVVTWYDFRGSDADVYAQRIDATGAVLWTADGEGVCVASGDQLDARIAPNGSGGAVIAWYDYRGSDADVYALGLNSDGSILPNEPVITSIADVAGDEGGWVRIRFQRSRLDSPAESEYPIVSYGVWRRIDGLSAAAPERAPAAGLPPGSWEGLGNIPAVNNDEYVFTARTVADSSAALTYSVYCVSAVTSTPSVHYVSAPDSGFSVDNLAPAAPSGFTVAYNAAGGNYLSWDPCAANDFHYFTVYRGDSAGFTPDSSSAVHHPTSTEWLDPVAQGWGYHYKITATDDAGNESEPSQPQSVTGVAEEGVPETLMLHQNAPNPFNPETVIRFDVPRAMKVTIVVYGVDGRTIRTLLDGAVAAGRRAVTWDGKDERGNQVATGVYFCRLEAAGIVQTRKLTLLK